MATLTPNSIAAQRTAAKTAGNQRLVMRKSYKSTTSKPVKSMAGK